MNNTRLLNALYTRSWLSITLALITALTAVILSLTQTPLYQARATYIVKLDDSFENDRSALDAVERLVRSQAVPATFVQVAQSRRVRELAASNAGLDAASLTNVQLTARFLPGSTILEIAVQGDNPEVVTTMANGSGDVVIELTREFFKVYALEPLDRATVPTAPFRPNVWLALGLGLAVGFILGIGILTLSIYLDPTQKPFSPTAADVTVEPLS